MSKLDRISKERAKAKEARRQAESETKAQLEALAQEREALKKERDELARVHKHLESLKRDPLRAMKELQIDPEDLLTRIAKDGTPEMEHQRYIDKLEDQVRNLTAWKEDFEQRRKQYEEEHVVQRQQQQRANIISTYLGEASKEESYPNFNFLYGDDQEKQVQLGHAAADELRESTGKQPTYEEILRHLESKASKRVASRFGEAPNKGQGVAAKGLPKTVSKSDMNDRTSISVPDDPDARRELAKQHVKAVVRRAELGE
jgi:hypothetical protein